ncbi:MAG: hypothetical protein M3Z25_17800 [Actinomycetota bacterium]|nr:hypothetical protein [Actinomycetota bacterium]
MEVGSLAEWANAGGSLLAFAGAGFAAFVTLKSFRLQKLATDATLDRLTAREREGQAGNFSVWIYQGRVDWHVWVSNASQLPVYDVRIRLTGPNIDLVIDRGTQGPKRAYNSEVLDGWVAKAVEAAAQGSHLRSDDLKIETRFVDARGLRWHRDVRGLLHEISSEDDVKWTLGKCAVSLELRSDPELRGPGAPAGSGAARPSAQEGRARPEGPA